MTLNHPLSLKQRHPCSQCPLGANPAFRAMTDDETAFMKGFKRGELQVQILNFVLPGDLVGLQGTLLAEMQHSVEALSDMMLCVFERNSLYLLFKNRPSLGFDVTWLAAKEEQILDEHLLSVGRRSALERAAYLISFLNQRAHRVGHLKEGRPLAPFTQNHIADTLGLSLVHTNKTLKKLQDKGIIEWSGKTCLVKDTKRLMDVANWDGIADIQRPFI